MELTKSERVAEMRAYSLWYGIGRAAKLGRGLILYQTHDNRWSAFLRAQRDELLAALEAGRVLEKALHACITNGEAEIKGTSLGADIVAHALNTFHKLADALRGK